MRFGKDQIERVHEATLQILARTGVRFINAEALEIFKKNGFKIEGDIVYFTATQIKEALNQCPVKFEIKGKNPNNNIILGSGKTFCGPVSGTVFVTDHINGRRESTSCDYVNFTKLSQSIDHMDIVGGMMVTAGDIPDSAKGAFMMTALLTHTDKPLWGISVDRSVSLECIKMLKLAFGDNPETVMMVLANVNTPLIYDNKMLDSIMAYALENQAVNISCCGISGFTTPITLAGTLAVNNAEVLAGIVFTQLVNSGTPVIYGNVSTVPDMRTMGIAGGAPEASVLSYAAAQMAKYYGIPSRTGGLFSEATSCDVQAGYESMLHAISAYQSGTDLLLMAAGSSDSFMTASYEKFMTDIEIGLMVKRYIRGIEVNQDTLVLDLIHEQGHGGNFITVDHTLENFREELFFPQISNRHSYDMWSTKGKSRVEQAYELCQSTIENFEIPKAVEDNKKIVRYWEDTYGDLPECLKSIRK